jgi:hypothetical protein
VVRHEVERRAAGQRGHGIRNQLLLLRASDERLQGRLAQQRQLVGVLVIKPHMSFEVLEQLLAARAFQHLLGCLQSAVRRQHVAVLVPVHASLGADARRVVLFLLLLVAATSATVTAVATATATAVAAAGTAAGTAEVFVAGDPVAPLAREAAVTSSLAAAASHGSLFEAMGAAGWRAF